MSHQIYITLPPGGTVAVKFLDTDGEITVEFDEKGLTGGGAIRVKADLPDAKGREGIIYEEDMGLYPPREEPAENILPQPTEVEPVEERICQQCYVDYTGASSTADSEKTYCSRECEQLHDKQLMGEDEEEGEDDKDDESQES